MKLPSIQQIAAGAGQSFIRFPLVLINALCGTVAAILLIDYEGPAGASFLFQVMFAALLGIPLLFGLEQMAEKRKWKMGPSIALQLLGVLLLLLYARTVPQHIPNAPALYTIRLLILITGLVFFASAAPFWGKNELNGFWHYNRILFFRLLTSLAYSVVLYAGLSFALAAMDNLFGIDVPGKRYGELAVLMLGVFNTWLFLSRVPGDLDALQHESEYPKGLKIFAQYILSPLVLVYLLILYAYLAKILIDWDWPQGWVSKLILGFSATGLFTLLLLYPIRDLTENRWIRLAWRWFFYILIPLLVMLPLAVWRRVSQYGFTEGRYLAMVLGGWLIFIVLYFLAGKGKNIKIIPTTLCVLALLVSFGPWGVFDISAASQVGRLQTLLGKNSILVDGHAQKAAAKPDIEDSRQISSILAYLHDLHGYQCIQPWFATNLQQESKAYKKPFEVAGLLGVEYMQGWMAKSAKEIDLSPDQNGILPIRGYDHLLRAVYFNKDQAKKEFADAKISYRFSTTLDALTFVYRSKAESADSIRIHLLPFLEQVLQTYGATNPQNIPCEKMCLTAATPTIKVMVYFRYVHLRRDGEILLPRSYNTDIFYSIIE
jgi:hypothetical protein